MVVSILNYVFNIVLSIINTLFSPINDLLVKYLPDSNTGIEHITQYLLLCLNNVNWVISALGIPRSLITYIIMVYFIIFTGSFLVFGFKISVKWFYKLGSALQ